MPKKTSLKDAKDYIALRLNGDSKKAAALAILGKDDPQTIRTMEQSEAYQVLYNTMANNQKLKMAQELNQLQLKKTKAYSNLLDQGDELLSKAETTEEKLQAMENQRRNLDVQLIEQAQSWNGPDRNKDASDTNFLEGVIL